MRPLDHSSDHQVAALLHKRYLAGFAVVAFLLFLNQLIVQPPLFRLESDAPVINTAGRQRMLSQRLAKAALAMTSADSDSVRGSRRRELEQVVTLWVDSHEGLRYGNPELSLPGDPPLEIRTEFQALDPVFESIRKSATRLIDAENPMTRSAALAAILKNEADFLTRMDKIVGLYEANARARAARLVWTGWLVTAAILIALLAIGRFTLIPASLVIQKQMTALAEARDQLEDRVQSRTAELKAANLRLEVEHRERLTAQEQHRRLLEQFSHASRINTMGEMASGLAHELNQPLGAIANYVGGCLERINSGLAHPRELREPLEHAQAVTLRAGEIIRSVRRFAKRHELEVETVDPGQLAKEAIGFLKDESEQRKIPVELELVSDLPLVACNPVQIQQVLVNLIRNGFDAIEAAKPEKPRIQVVITRGSDKGAWLSVIDNGEGLEKSRLDRMFDPFFSTRAEGMGMGLAICRGIIEAHHGKIEAESKIGVQTIVRFFLPEVESRP